ncbi:hypothetical protein GCM10010168_05510 [Actinoplanes ianthinogenes]|uniref:Thrombospondin n=1 Tax=Actinoplanes ianthinogenes TaxID=122358 RepID=A0ABN6CBA7_9ACTN|nr:hypothetical protein [Actinoplanes ianthinogenes]BCJ42707.1 hypothetical protein Aiant_33640 [Actinoplanes ianthinogenes]GGQ92754.1 hypothetical protein GCM10010168_05510 [Actinoplanes ianthinogenes]
MRIPTFSRAATTDTAETARVPVQPRRDDDTTQDITKPRTTDTNRDINTPRAVNPPRVSTVTPPTEAERKPVAVGRPATEPAPARRPRASLLATLGLIVSVAGIALVLSGPLAGWGIGVAGLGLVLSLAGLNATRKQHVAGKTDALIGVLVAIGAIVLGVLALNGSLAWLGTDTQPASHLREWLDAQFANRF